MTLYRKVHRLHCDQCNVPMDDYGYVPVKEPVYRFGKGAYGIRTFEQALDCLAVAENGGDVEEVLAALRTMVEIGGDDEG